MRQKQNKVGLTFVQATSLVSLSVQFQIDWSVWLGSAPEEQAIEALEIQPYSTDDHRAKQWGSHADGHLMATCELNDCGFLSEAQAQNLIVRIETVSLREDQPHQFNWNCCLHCYNKL